MTESRCQKLSARLQSILALAKNYDDNLAQKQVSSLFTLQDKLIDEINLFYDELWPPEKFPRINLTVGGDTPIELHAKLLEGAVEGKRKFNFPSDDRTFKILQAIYESDEFKSLSVNPEDLCLVRVQVKDLDADRALTTQAIFNKAAKLGLSLCHPVVALYLLMSNDYEKVCRVATEIDPDPRKLIAPYLTENNGLSFNLAVFGGWSPEFQFVFQFPRIKKPVRQNRGRANV